jgi:hypothetical protein
MPPSDQRTQPWEKWFIPRPGDALTGRLILQGNNGNDNTNRHVFDTCSPATSASKRSIEARMAKEADKRVAACGSA